MYSIYSTEGIVLKADERGEHDRTFLILTKDFGLVRAHAKGVRKLESKLRYSLSCLAVSDISFVLGRGMWRLSGATLQRNVATELRGQSSALAFLSRVASLIIRLVPGEEKNEALYENFKNACFFVAERKPEGELLRNTEYLLALRILFCLGYLGDHPNWQAFITTPTFESDVVKQVSGVDVQIVEAINKAIRESHL
jgi:DNA repair protein RecO (recombination protein O)